MKSEGDVQVSNPCEHDFDRQVRASVVNSYIIITVSRQVNLTECIYNLRVFGISAGEDEDMTMLMQLTRSLDQGAGIECLDLMIRLLERKNMTSTLTSSTGCMSQLAHCVVTACTDFEQQLQVCLS